MPTPAASGAEFAVAVVGVAELHEEDEDEEALWFRNYLRNS